MSLFCMRRLVERLYFLFFLFVMKGNKQVPFRLITRRGRESREGRKKTRAVGERKEIRQISQRLKCKLSIFIPPVSYCCGRTGKSLSSVPVVVFCHPTLCLFTVLLVSGAKDGQFICRNHQIFYFFVATKTQPPSIFCQSFKA